MNVVVIGWAGGGGTRGDVLFSSISAALKQSTVAPAQMPVYVGRRVSTGQADIACTKREKRFHEAFDESHEGLSASYDEPL